MTSATLSTSNRAEKDVPSPGPAARAGAFLSLLMVVAAAFVSAWHMRTARGLAYAQTVRTVDATLILLVIAVPLYFLRYRARCYSEWWLAFWTVSLAAFAIHLYFAIFRFFHGRFLDIFHDKADVTHPVLDLLLFIWWVIDVSLAWTATPDPFVRGQRAVLHVILTLAFFQATREEDVSRTGVTLGILLFLATLAAGIFWATIRRPAPTGAA